MMFALLTMAPPPQVGRNLRRFGPNELGTDTPTPFWLIYVRQLYQPLILILFAMLFLSVLALQRDFQKLGYGERTRAPSPNRHSLPPAARRPCGDDAFTPCSVQARSRTGSSWSSWPR